MRFVTFDTETHLIRPGLLAPRMVCLSLACREPNGQVFTDLLSREEGLDLVESWLKDDDVTIIGHNVTYDLGVVVASAPRLLPLVFAKYEKGLILDTITRQILIDIAEGQAKYFIDEESGEFTKTSYTLADLSYRLNKRYVKKGSDTWRLRYALLDDVPIEGWPDDAKKYAIDDAEITLEVFEAQERLIQQVDWTFNNDTRTRELPNQKEQHQASWALHLMSTYGVRTDGAAVAKLRAELQAEYDEFMEKLRPSGLFNIQPARVNRKGRAIPELVTKNMKEIYRRVTKCFADQGKPLQTTATGKPSTDRKTLGETGDEDLMRLAEAGATAKLLTTYVPVLERGTEFPINARYNSPMETGRTSAANPNLQNPPRKGGVRECFVPRNGWVYVFCDYDTLELRALSQVCLDILGWSTMAEALRRGEDLHLSLAAQMMGISVEDAKERYAAGDAEVREYRQQAKPANFGFPGGMGAEGFRVYAEGYGITIDETQATELRNSWFRTWQEMRNYFDFISRVTESSDQITQLRSGRVRGGANFCAAANTLFQGLAADGAKEALWRVARECYVDRASPLFGCRPVLFLHDEIGVEIRYDDPARASRAADRLAQVMIQAMEAWIPSVPITCKPVMVRRWLKGAEPVRIDGVLVPSRSVKDGKKTMWVADVEAEQPQVAA